MWGWGDQRKPPLAGLEQKASERGGEPHRHLEAGASGPRPRGNTGTACRQMGGADADTVEEKKWLEMRSERSARPHHGRAWGSILSEQDCDMWSVYVWLSHSVLPDSETPWTVALQAPLSMGFSRQEYWSGLLLPPPGDLPHPGIKPNLLHLLHGQVGPLPLHHLGSLLWSALNAWHRSLHSTSPKVVWLLFVSSSPTSREIKEEWSFPSYSQEHKTGLPKGGKEEWSVCSINCDPRWQGLRTSEHKAGQGHQPPTSMTAPADPPKCGFPSWWLTLSTRNPTGMGTKSARRTGVRCSA